MNHPKLEEWTPYLCGEASPEQKRQLTQHLADCSMCREEIESWQRSLRHLDAWKLPPAKKPAAAFAPALRWAMAAAIVLFAGFAAGRLSAPRLSVAAVREAIEPALREQRLAANKRMDDAIAAMARGLESKRAEDTKAFLAIMSKLESQHAADVMELKSDLDTVALNTDAGLRQTEQQLIQLADYNQPASHQ